MSVLMGTFDEWLSTPAPEGQRYGQHLMNTAPPHIYDAATGDFLLDCFYDRTVDSAKIKNFVLFAEMVWDVYDPDEIRLARHLIAFS